MNQAMNPTEPLKPNTNGMLRLFVYGTLKRGFWNHDRFCRGVLAVEDALVRGRLFETSSGIPVLQVPEEDILAVGTTNPLADVATQAHVTARMSNPEPTPDRLPKKGTGAPWGPVYGELLAFDDPESRLPAIDRLEGFHPGGPCLYRRVLVPIRTNGTVLPAWLYVVGDPWTGSFKELTAGIWRCNSGSWSPSGAMYAADSRHSSSLSLTGMDRFRILVSGLVGIHRQ
ncbi:MAG: gamma-glutamylcyclotransferase family protein [Acidobacteriota bacterium]|nr:gamma-glutamylcyclotransferase family protein [Acidobacteriota bacterium]